MKVLLTGSTGFLGNNLLRALLLNGEEVFVLVRSESDLRALDNLDVEKIHGDLADSSQIGLAAEGVDLIIHSAALIQLGWSRLESCLKVNVEGTRVLAETARRRKIRMIHVSTVDTLAVGSREKPADEACFIPPKPQCSYVVSKTRADQAFREQLDLGLDGVIVKPGFMVGPYDWKPSSGAMMMAIAKQYVPFAPAGGCSVADVRDVTAGIISAAQHGRSGESYILGGENLSYFELWGLMASVMGRRPPSFVLPDWLARTAGIAGDLAGKFSRSEPQVNSAATSMGQMTHYYSSEKAKKELGYEIGPVETALIDAWEWFKAHGYL